jgi:hypothetical protein
VSLLSDFLYTLPHCDLISGDLLDQTYIEVWNRVLGILDEQDSLQFVLNESPDINHRRMVSLSVVIPGFGSFYLENEHVNDKSFNALLFIKWIF